MLMIPMAIGMQISASKQSSLLPTQLHPL